ncbi:MAG: hypothetical protein AB7F21_11350 [Desulfuromonadales bacterium]
MKKLAIGMFMSMAFVFSTFSVATAAIEVEGDAYVGVADKYLWRGWNLSGSKAVLQGGVDASANGFTLSYWSNIQLNSDADWRSGEATETDTTLDYSFDVNELLSMSVGHIFYALDNINDTAEFYVGAGLNTLLSPALTVYWDYDEADDNGLFFAASIGHDFALTDELGLSLGALVSYNDGSDYSTGDYSDWHNYELSAGLSYALSEQVSLDASTLFSEGISDEARANLDSEMVSSLSVTFAF